MLCTTWLRRPIFFLWTCSYRSTYQGCPTYHRGNEALLYTSLHRENACLPMTERSKRNLAPTKARCRLPKKFSTGETKQCFGTVVHARAHPRPLLPDTCRFLRKRATKAPCYEASVQQCGLTVANSLHRLKFRQCYC